MSDSKKVIVPVPWPKTRQEAITYINAATSSSDRQLRKQQMQYLLYSSGPIKLSQIL